MKPAFNESEIENVLENLPPDISPRLEKKLSSAPWTPRATGRHRALVLLYCTAILFIAFIGLTPQGRAFAQSIIEFFITTDQSSSPLSEEELDSIYAPDPPRALSLVDVTPLAPLSDYCSNPEGLGTYECEIQRVELRLGYDLKEFLTNPSGWYFRQAMSSQDYAVITYQTGGGYLDLRQGIGNFPPDHPDIDWGKVLSSTDQSVKIDDYQGEYVNGSFSLKNGASELTWDSTGSDQRIRWKEGERWFEILALSGPGASGYLDREALILLASNMVYQPESTEQNTKVDLDSIPNIPLAEKICQCDILQPRKLPSENTHFDYVRYDPQQKSITLHYGYRALRIVQTPVESALIKNLDSYKMLETVEVNGAIGQFGVSPAQKTIWESATPPVFTTNNSYNILLWEKDGTIYQIYFDQSFSGGGYLTKDQMIE